ncbi:MAG: pantoate--beta-alanine ligase [Candidatus Krumholzibacteriota bacterium]
MKVCRTSAELAALSLKQAGRPLVLVPTMGALHRGHLSLVGLGRKFGPVVVSIFVNPTQFGEGEDFKAYPRDLEGDLTLLEPLEVAAVFAPEVSQVYGAAGEVTVLPGNRGQGLCGGDRPGHFSGVLTVVAKLFGAVRPDIAVFGRKDAQQCLVIAQMVEDLRLGVRLVDGPTVREPDGLAMSSRNRYLDPGERARALCLHGALSAGRDLLGSGERNREKVVAVMREKLAAADHLEYAEVRRVPDLAVQEHLTGRVLLAVAARVGPARLIDNFVLNVSEHGVTDGVLLGDPAGPQTVQGGFDERE